MPELCDNCGQEASHFRPAEVLCTGCLPENPRPYVELLARTPPHCRECGEEATSYRRPHTSCRGLPPGGPRQLSPPGKLAQGAASTATTRAPPPSKREFEENYTEIGHDPRTGNDCLRAQGSGGTLRDSPPHGPTGMTSQKHNGTDSSRRPATAPSTPSTTSSCRTGMRPRISDAKQPIVLGDGERIKVRSSSPRESHAATDRMTNPCASPVRAQCRYS